jgi:hypothetical protein
VKCVKCLASPLLVLLLESGGVSSNGVPEYMTICLCLLYIIVLIKIVSVFCALYI